MTTHSLGKREQEGPMPLWKGTTPAGGSVGQWELACGSMK